MGGDYTRETIVGADDVEAWGGRVAVIPLTRGQSTTSIIARLRGQRV
jgi:bifunctional ADP-heptose synthase (sugar kinase/adenylyltransferase)